MLTPDPQTTARRAYAATILARVRLKNKLDFLAMAMLE